MKIFRSFKFRLSLWSALISGSIVLFFSLGAVLFLMLEHLNTIEDEIEQFGSDLVEEVDDSDRLHRKTLADLFDLFDDRKNLHLVALISPDGDTVFRSSHWKDFHFNSTGNKKDRFSFVRHEKEYWRLGEVSEDDWKVIVATSLDETEEASKDILWAFALMFPLAVILAALGGLILAWKAFKPVDEIIKTSEGIQGDRLNRRIPEANDNFELNRLIHVLNSMLDRLEKSFNQAIRFSADASHELNTPLTIMQGELESALQREDLGADETTRLAALLDETQRLKTITRSLLLLSQTDAGELALNRTDFDMSLEIEDVLEDIQLMDGAESITFEKKIDRTLVVSGDRILLRQAIHNLFRNAVRYNQPAGRVAVTVKAENQKLVCSLSNTGPGIAPGNRKKVFERFFRDNPSRSGKSDSYGLGLSLSREIIHAHGGSIWLEKADVDETVFCFVLSLV